MATAKFSTKGQLVVPKELRDRYDWSAGTAVEFIDEGDGVKIKVPAVQKRYTIDDLYGILPYSGPPKTLEDMQRGIDEAMAERWARKSK
jgi:AbrB family looped-hinge helix DNA binding protein